MTNSCLNLFDIDKTFWTYISCVAKVEGNNIQMIRLRMDCRLMSGPDGEHRGHLQRDQAGRRAHGGERTRLRQSAR